MRTSGSARSPAEPAARGRRGANGGALAAIRRAAALLVAALACGDPGAPAAATAPPPTDAAPDARAGAPAPAPAPGDRGDPLAALDLAPLAPEPRAAWPTESPHITSYYGWRVNPITGVGHKLHRGLDLRGQTGDLALAIADGQVRFAGHDPFLGRCVILDHGAGITSWYGHLSDLLVAEGMPVARGAAVGLIGNTGRSQAPHLHLTVKIGAVAVDPLWLLGLPLFPYPALIAEPPAADAEDAS